MEEGEARRGGGGPHAARAYYLAGGCVDPPPLYPILFSSLFPYFSFTFFASLRGYPPRSVPGFLNSDWIQLWSFGNRLFDYRIVMSGNHNKNGTMISPDKLFFDSPIELRLRSDSGGELIRVISTIAADVIGERELLEELVRKGEEKLERSFPERDGDPRRRGSWRRKGSGANKTKWHRERRELPFKDGCIVTRCKRVAGIEERSLSWKGSRGEQLVRSSASGCRVPIERAKRPTSREREREMYRRRGKCVHAHALSRRRRWRQREADGGGGVVTNGEMREC